MSIRTPDLVHDPGGGPEDLDVTLRPRVLEEFVGQEALREELSISLHAASERGEALDHVLLAGPPGLGKTSLAQIVAAELDVPFVQTAGPALERKGDVAAFLTSLEPRSVFFIDEIHRLPRAVEEIFYPAMEDRQLPITVGQGAGARVMTLPLPAFTLIGATTRAGLLTTPLRDRFGIQHRLDHYDPSELARIVVRSARVLEVEIDAAGARAIAERSRGTPRVANRLLKRVRDFAQVRGTRGDRRGHRGGGPGDARGRRCGAGPPRSRVAPGHLRSLRRRAGRALDARRHRRGGGRHDRGGLRALPAPARVPPAHAARSHRDAARVPPPGHGRARARLTALLRAGPIRR